MRRLAILISGRGSNMLAVHQAILRQEVPAEIACVISDRADAPGLKRARQLGITCEVAPYEHRIARPPFERHPSIVCVYPGYDRRAERIDFEKALTQALMKSKPDLIVLAGFMRVLSKDFVTAHPHMINIHPSLLPLHRGLDTHARVLEAGEKTHGATVHYVTAELDAGPLLIQKSIQVQGERDAEALAANLLPYEHLCLILAVRLICEGRIEYIPDEQKIYLDGKLLPPTGLSYGVDDEITYP